MAKALISKGIFVFQWTDNAMENLFPLSTYWYAEKPASTRQCIPWVGCLIVAQNTQNWVQGKEADLCVSQISLNLPAINSPQFHETVKKVAWKDASFKIVRTWNAKIAVLATHSFFKLPIHSLRPLTPVPCFHRIFSSITQTLELSPEHKFLGLQFNNLGILTSLISSSLTLQSLCTYAPCVPMLLLHYSSVKRLSLVLEFQSPHTH